MIFYILINITVSIKMTIATQFSNKIKQLNDKLFIESINENEMILISDFQYKLKLSIIDDIYSVTLNNGDYLLYEKIFNDTKFDSIINDIFDICKPKKVKTLEKEYDKDLWEQCNAKIRKYSDNSSSVNNSIVVSPDNLFQVNGAMCGLIAIYDANPQYLSRYGIVSPWSLFKWLVELGWTFTAGDMLDNVNFQSISELLDCQIKVLYNNISETLGNKTQPILTIHAKGAHFLNGDEL